MEKLAKILKRSRANIRKRFNGQTIIPWLRKWLLVEFIN